MAEGGYNTLDKALTFAAAYQGAANGRIRTGLAAHAPYTCGPEFLQQVAAAAREKGYLLGIHLAETTEEDVYKRQVLKRAERGHSAEQSLAAARLLQESGFHWGVQLMPGLPGEEKKKVLPLAAKLLAFGPDTLRLYPTLVLANTPLAKLWQSGCYQPLSLPEAVEVCRDLTILAEYYGCLLYTSRCV